MEYKDKYIQVVCSNCYPEGMLGFTDNLRDPDYINCDDCGHPTKIIPLYEVTNPDFFIEAASDTLEFWNHHNETHIPRQIYETGKQHVSPEKLLDYAKGIYQEFAYEFWKSK